MLSIYLQIKEEKYQWFKVWFSSKFAMDAEKNLVSKQVSNSVSCSREVDKGEGVGDRFWFCDFWT